MPKSPQKPSVGRVVIYCWPPEKQRMNNHSAQSPAIIVRTWEGTAYQMDEVNLAVIPDGPGTLWETSVPYSEGNEPHTWHWPAIVNRRDMEESIKMLNDWPKDSIKDKPENCALAQKVKKGFIRENERALEDNDVAECIVNALFSPIITDNTYCAFQLFIESLVLPEHVAFYSETELREYLKHFMSSYKK